MTIIGGSLAMLQIEKKGYKLELLNPEEVYTALINNLKLVIG